MERPRKTNAAYAGFVGSLVIIATAFTSIPLSYGNTSYSFYYTVQSGDTLSSISQKFQVTSQSIVNANHMHHPYKVYVGELLIIPLNSPSVTYTVQSGDSLSLIGQKFEVSWQSIAEANSIVSPYTIYPGEVLTIPLITTTTTSSTATSTTSSTTSTSYSSTTSTSIITTSSSSLTTSTYTTSSSSSSSITTTTSTLTSTTTTTSTVCVYQSTGGADGSGWWCWTVSTSTLTGAGLSADLQGTATYFGVCPATLEQDNGYTSNAPVWSGEILAIPNGVGCPRVTTTTTTTTSSSSLASSTRQAWVWLWENYASGLSDIQQHPGALSVVSPDTYYLSDSGTFTIYSTQAEICPQVHSLGLKCDPLIQNDQSNPIGINTLLTDTTLQTTFINAAVNEAVNSNLDGYNVDFEPSTGILNVASQYGVFLNNFANAMHAVGKQLSVDVATWDGGELWNYQIIGSTNIDLVITMDTYDSSYTTFTQGLNYVLSTVPLSKVGVGLLTVTDDATLQQRVQAVETSNVGTLSVWPSYPGFLTDMYWGNLTQYQQSEVLLR